VAKLRTTFVPAPLPQVKTIVGDPGNSLSDAEILKKVEATGIKGVILEEIPPSDSFLIVEAASLVPLLKFLRDEFTLEFNFLQVISATDFVASPATEETKEIKPRCEILYVVYSLPLRKYLNVKVVLPRENPQIESVSHLFRCANWYERECYDMIGIFFKNHPHLERILLPPDWVGHPLRRDYVFPEEYNGMKVPL
jgi:NADH-quinone oxidoreductase subunit C